MAIIRHFAAPAFVARLARGDSPGRYLQVDVVVAQQAVEEDADQPHHAVLLHLVLQDKY